MAASVTNPVRELNLSVTFPVGFYPDEKNVQVYYQKLPSGAPIEDRALRARPQFTGQTILFNLPYPLMGYRYAIAWKPVAARPLSKRAKAFQGRCLANGVGDSSASSFLRGLEGEWSGLCSVALYVPEPECSTPGRFLRRAGTRLAVWRGRGRGPKLPRCKSTFAPGVACISIRGGGVPASLLATRASSKSSPIRRDAGW